MQNGFWCYGGLGGSFSIFGMGKTRNVYHIYSRWSDIGCVYVVPDFQENLVISSQILIESINGILHKNSRHLT